ncbi:MAG: helix-turn-helix transcriptional regulator [Henriciella sp.]|nr:helix-turn-helix transcriptional regulator [Henriciella sp.]
MYDSASVIFDTFVAAYRYLHSQSITIEVKPVQPSLNSPLSRREIECLQWLAVGKTISEAACILGISERTLRFHVTNARNRLGVSTTMQAVVAAALRYGFDPNDPRRSLYTASRGKLNSFA